MVKPEYKQTEIGILPEEWDAISFEDCFSVLPNNTLSRAELNGNGGEIRNIHYGDILVKYPAVLDCFSENLPYINEANTAKASKGFLRDGDLIMADTAEDTIVGKSTEVISVGDSKVVSGLHTIPCRPKNADMFAPKWLGYFINHNAYHDQLIPYITGIKVSSVSKSAISSTVIAVPPKPEQEAIAAALSDMDELIANLEKLIAKKKAIKQGAMQELLTGRRRLPGFSGEWKTGVWDDVVSGFSSGATPYRGVPSYYNGQIRWVSSGELKYNVILDTIEHISSEAMEKTSLTIHPAGTFLMAITGLEAVGTRGSCAILGAPSTTNQSCMAIYGTEKMCTSFLFHYYSLFGDELALKYCQGTKQQSYTASIVKTLPITYPTDITEQVAIVEILNSMDTEIDNLEKKLSKYKYIESGMMSELLTGRIRLV